MTMKNSRFNPFSDDFPRKGIKNNKNIRTQVAEHKIKSFEELKNDLFKSLPMANLHVDGHHSYEEI